MTEITKIAELRKALGMTQKDLAEKLVVHQTAVSFWERGEGLPDIEKLCTLGELFGVSVDFLLGRTSNPAVLQHSSINRVSIYKGSLSGEPVGYEYIPVEWISADKRYFGIEVTDDSMSPYFLPGDIVLALESDKCTSGQCCVVEIGDAPPALRRIIAANGNPTLLNRTAAPAGYMIQALNPAIDSVFYTAKEVKALPVKILGVVVQTRRNERG